MKDLPEFLFSVIIVLAILCFTVLFMPILVIDCIFCAAR